MITRQPGHTVPSMELTKASLQLRGRRLRFDLESYRIRQVLFSSNTQRMNKYLSDFQPRYVEGVQLLSDPMTTPGHGSDDEDGDDYHMDIADDINKADNYQCLIFFFLVQTFSASKHSTETNRHFFKDDMRLNLLANMAFHWTICRIS